MWSRLAKSLLGWGKDGGRERESYKEAKFLVKAISFTYDVNVLILIVRYVLYLNSFHKSTPMIFVSIETPTFGT